MDAKKENEVVHEQGTVYVDESNLDVVLSTKPPNMFKLFMREVRRDIFAMVGIALLIIIFLVIYIGTPIINSQMDVMRTDLLNRNQSPEESGTLLGTDSSGREIAPLLLVSARNSLNISLAVTALSFILGLIVGLLAGFYGGHTDNVIMRVVDTWSMLPFLMCIIAVMAIVGERTPGLFIIVFTLFTWVGRSRLVRAATLQQRNLDFVSASKTLGTRNFVIIIREILPNIVDVVVANFVLTFAANIGIETGITILGFGLGIEHPTLGSMINSATMPMNLQFRWWTWMPAIIMVVTIMLCINFVGNALQRVADPRQRLT